MFTKSVGGHYKSFVAIDTWKQDEETLQKTIPKETWFEFDDDAVSPIQIDQVVNKNAFLLFFEWKEFKASTIANLLQNN